MKKSHLPPAAAALLQAGAVSFLFFVLEIIAGWFSGSVGILSEAMNLLVDVLTYCVSVAAVCVGTWEPTDGWKELIDCLSTYCFSRLTFNSLLSATMPSYCPTNRTSSIHIRFYSHRARGCDRYYLDELVRERFPIVSNSTHNLPHPKGLAFGLVSEAIYVFRYPNPIDAPVMLSAASVSLVRGAWMLWVLRTSVAASDDADTRDQSHVGNDEEERLVVMGPSAAAVGDSKSDAGAASTTSDPAYPAAAGVAAARDNVNINVAIVNTAADCFGSFVVFCTALILMFRPDWTVLDPLSGLISGTATFIAPLTIIDQYIGILMEACPSTVRTSDVKRSLLELPFVQSINSMRIWSLTNNRNVCVAGVSLRLEDVVGTNIRGNSTSRSSARLVNGTASKVSSRNVEQFRYASWAGTLTAEEEASGLSRFGGEDEEGDICDNTSYASETLNDNAAQGAVDENLFNYAVNLVREHITDKFSISEVYIDAKLVQ
ncbi:hypothetical protein HDU84_003112 [Entophlyctis sp. JEL0112]|nr:hypothetical protein HDU84_003112 [Entophlyctis sp. JEL0112]